MADVQIAVIDQQNTQIALAAPAETQVTAAVPGIQGPQGETGDVAVAQDGTAALPGIRFESDTNTGIYRPGADQLALSTAGTGRLFVDASGNVGVGAGAPPTLGANYTTLTLCGRSADFGGGIIFESSDSSDRTYLYGDSGAFYAITQDSRPLILGTNGTEKLRITADGKVGVGTSAPGESVEIQAPAGASQNVTIRLRANDAGGISGSVADISAIGTGPQVSALAFSTRDGVNIVERLRITGDGKVGVGTSAPSYDWQVDKDVNSLATAYVRSYNAGSSAGGRVIAASDVGGLSMTAHSSTHSAWANTCFISSESAFTGGLVIGANGANPIRFWNNGTERARIDSSGRLLVGTSSDTSGGLLQIRTSSTSNRNVSFRSDQASLGYPFIQYFDRSANNAAVSNNESLGTILFRGHDGTTLISSARIAAEVDGTPGANDMPGRLVFSTTADGASSPTERMRIDSSGRVGINTTSPNYALDVSATGTTISSSFTSNLSEQYIALKDSGTTLGHVRLGSMSGAMLFRAGNAERARIDSSGRLLVGTSSDSGGALLQVNGDRIRVATAKTPASATATGTAGEICWDADYIYVCTATNTWKRAALSTW